MSRKEMAFLLVGAIATSAYAEDRTWRKDVAPIVASRCGGCHGASAPEFNDWMLLGDAKRETVPPRMDTYPHFMSYVVWPATGAVMRRLDDGKASGGTPGNMYRFLGANDAERAKNLKIIKDWLGDGAWNLNRWNARNGVPGVSKEQLEKIKAKY
jgi:hypothetical protein